MNNQQIIDNNKELYMKNMLSLNIVIPMKNIDINITQLIEKKIKEQVEGKCISEGYVRPNSVKLVSNSSGNIKNNDIIFTTVYECFVCHPVEGMNIDFIVKTITKAGIHGYVEDTFLDIKPIFVFIARDHHYSNNYFSKIKEGEKVTGKIFGVNYQLNDQHIYVIAELKLPSRFTNSKKQRGGNDDSDNEDEDEDEDEA